MNEPPRYEGILPKLTLTIEGRDDGGLRVYSEDLPGLVLSHSDPDLVMREVLPTIRVLLGYMMEKVP